MPEFVPPTTVSQAIEQAAISGVKKSAEGEREQENFPIKDMIEADRYLIGKRAAAKPHFGMRMTKCIPPGGG